MFHAAIKKINLGLGYVCPSLLFLSIHNATKRISISLMHNTRKRNTNLSHVHTRRLPPGPQIRAHCLEVSQLTARKRGIAKRRDTCIWVLAVIGHLGSTGVKSSIDAGTFTTVSPVPIASSSVVRKTITIAITKPIFICSGAFLRARETISVWVKAVIAI